MTYSIPQGIHFFHVMRLFQSWFRRTASGDLGEKYTSCDMLPAIGYVTMLCEKNSPAEPIMMQDPQSGGLKTEAALTC